MKVQLTVPRKNRVRVIAERDGSPVVFEDFSPGDAAARRRVAEKLGVEDKDFVKRIMELSATNLVVVWGVEEAASEQFVITRRPITASEGAAIFGMVPLDAMKLAVATPGGGDEVLTWNGGDRKRLIVLDIDYHGGSAPVDVEKRDRLITMLRPRPSAWWLSRHGGVHLAYVGTPDFDADELAAAAGLAWLNLDPKATFDLVNQVRVPQGDVIWEQQDSSVAGLANTWLRSEVSREVTEAYLSDHDYEVGRRYPHDRCPVSPCPSHAEPVEVRETHITCHRCRSLGVRMGSRSPGVFPYTSLVDGSMPGIVATMVKRFTHWEHAKLVLMDVFRVQESVVELAYRGCLKHLHGSEDERIAKVFTAGNDVIRCNKMWVTRDVNGVHNKKLDFMLAPLPAVQDENGRVSGETVARFQQGIDLREYGYPDVSPIRGIRMYGHNLPVVNPDLYTVVVPSVMLSLPSQEQYRPRYRKAGERMTLDAAFEVLESAMPGMDRNYLLLLVAAKGCSEGQSGMPPLMMVTGPSGSGKTALVNLAAAICGDYNTECTWTKNVERLRQQLQKGARDGSFITVNEILKDAERQRSDAIQALDVFLNVTPDSVSHEMYLGPSKLGRVPACICTDIAIPQKLRDDEQIARRFVYVRIGSAHQEWPGTLIDSGLGRPELLRLWHEGRGAAAADAIVSYVIDTYFDVPRTFQEVAKELGFYRLSDSPDFDNPIADLKLLYQEWQNTPGDSEGWRKLSRGEDTPLAQVWAVVCDDESTDKWFTSRRASGEDWARVLGKGTSIKFEARRRRSTLSLRFVEG